MNNFKSLLFGLSLIAVTLLSCSKEDLGYQGDLTVTLKPVGSTEITEGDAGTVKYTVVLSNPLNEYTAIQFKVDELAQNPVFRFSTVDIKKGATTGELLINFKEKPSYKNILTKDIVYHFKLEKIHGVSNKAKLSGTPTLTVKKKVGPTPLTKAQMGFVDAWKKAKKDLSKFIGRIPVTAKVTVSADDKNYLGLSATSVTYTGFSNITVGTGATNDKMVLKMENNAMGIKDFLRTSFRKQTVEDEAYWYSPTKSVGVAPDYMPANQAYVVKQLLGTEKYNQWKAKTNQFDVALDKLEFKADKTVTFWYPDGAYDTSPHHASDPAKDQVLGQADGGDTMDCIQFLYYFPFYDYVYDKVKADPTNYAKFYAGGSIHPDHYLGNDVINSDTWSESLYVAPTSSYDIAKGEIKFTFVFEGAGNQADVYKIEVTYKVAD